MEISKNNTKKINILLEIDDGSNIFEILIDKKILCSYAFFEKMLCNCFLEEKLHKIKLNVHNTIISCDILLSFTGKEIDNNKLKNWYYLLNYIICCDYFMIKCEPSLLLNIKIPEQGFELLLQTCEILNYKNEVLTCVLNNLPLDYDINTLTNELKTKICEKNEYYLVFYMYCDDIYNFISYGDVINRKENNSNLYGNNIKIYDSRSGNFINMICMYIIVSYFSNNILSFFYHNNNYIIHFPRIYTDY